MIIYLELFNIRTLLYNKLLITTMEKTNPVFKIGAGLHNLGNTCFFNAVTQVILHTDSLTQALQQQLHSSICKKQKWCIICNLEKLVLSSKSGNHVVSPNQIVGNLKVIFKKFRLGRQEDSHEFLRYLVEGMQEAETGKLDKERSKSEFQIAKTIAFKVFGGRLRTFVHCLSCQHHSLTSQRYYDISIECQKSNSLWQGLKNFFKVDELSGTNKYRCENCKQLSNARKGFSILTVPDVVTFQLKRFTNTMRKIGKYIKYPEVLDLKHFIDTGSDHNHDSHTKMQLFGIVVHAGSSSYSGHYYSFIKHGNNWFEMNDSNVHKVKQETAFGQQAYLLFYRKIGQKHTFTPENYKKIDQEQIQYIRDIEAVNKVQMEKNKQHKQQLEKKEQIKVKNSSPLPKKLKNGQIMTNIVSSSMKSQQKQKNREQILSKSEQKIQMNGHKKRKISEDEEINEKRQKIKSNINMEIKKLLDKQHLERKQKQGEEAKFIEIGGKKIKAKVFGSPQHSDDSIEVPTQLKRKRSKQQARSEMSIMEIILKYSEDLSYLRSKLPRQGVGHRLMRPIYNLRKSEIVLKKRKLG